VVAVATGNLWRFLAEICSGHGLIDD